MAQRDRSQGFGFVYVDVKKLLEQRNESTEAEVPTIPPTDSKVVNFNKDPQKTSDFSSTDPTRERATAILQIRENLDRLQTLHHKLHAMLDELDQITDRDKKRR